MLRPNSKSTRNPRNTSLIKVNLDATPGRRIVWSLLGLLRKRNTKSLLLWESDLTFGLGKRSPAPMTGGGK